MVRVGQWCSRSGQRLSFEYPPRLRSGGQKPLPTFSPAFTQMGRGEMPALLHRSKFVSPDVRLAIVRSLFAGLVFHILPFNRMRSKRFVIERRTGILAG